MKKNVGEVRFMRLIRWASSTALRLERGGLEYSSRRTLEELSSGVECFLGLRLGETKCDRAQGGHVRKCMPSGSAVWERAVTRPA